MTGGRRKAVASRVGALGAALALLAGCTTPDASEPTSSPEPTASANATRPVLQRLPATWRQVPWGGAARRAPKGDAALPDLLQDPTPARLVHHPVERWDDPSGWSGERLFFLGIDDRWRALDMSDLGLPDDWWPGPDTHGSGALSSDGRTWATLTDAGIVLVGLDDGSVRHIDFPTEHPMVRWLTWLPGEATISAYSSGPARASYRTFHVDSRTGRVHRVRYPGWRTRFDVDATPVELSRSGSDELTAKIWESAGPESTTWPLDLGIRRTTGLPFGAFGETHVAIYAYPSGKNHSGPAQIWVLDKHTGEATARLRVPAPTSIEGWSRGKGLRLLVDNRRLIEWQPQTAEIRRLLELPGPYPMPGEWAAATVALPSR